MSQQKNSVCRRGKYYALQDASLCSITWLRLSTINLIIIGKNCGKSL